MKAHRFLSALLLAGSFAALPFVAGCNPNMDWGLCGTSNGHGGIHDCSGSVAPALPVSAPLGECCDQRQPNWITISRGLDFNCSNSEHLYCRDINPYAQPPGDTTTMCISGAAAVPPGWVVVNYPTDQPAGCYDVTSPKIAAQTIMKIADLKLTGPLIVCDMPYQYGTFARFNVGAKQYDSRCNNGVSATQNAFTISN